VTLADLREALAQLVRVTHSMLPQAPRGCARLSSMRALLLLHLVGRRGRARALAAPRRLRTPHSGYHGQGEVDFFEGWYSRLTLPAEETSVALIYAVFDPGAKTARTGVEAQALVAAPGGVRAARAAAADVSRFAAAPHALDVRQAFGGGEAFAMTSTAHRGRVGDVEWDFSVAPAVGWGGRFDDAGARQYSTAGWLAALGPLVSPHYQVLQSLGHATGVVRAWGREYAFARAPFYAEKNWGRGFPRRWWWIQCNAFDDPAREVTLTATGATRALLAGSALLAREEDVALIGLHVDGEFLPFPDVEWTVDAWGTWRVRGAYDGATVDIVATAPPGDAGAPVRVPTPEGMRPGARETYRGSLSVEVRRGGAVVLSATSSLACLEVGGDHAAPWAGRSAMTEPLRTVAYDVRLERAVSARLAAAQARGWVDVPGL